MPPRGFSGIQLLIGPFMSVAPGPGQSQASPHFSSFNHLGYSPRQNVCEPFVDALEESRARPLCLCTLSFSFSPFSCLLLVPLLLFLAILITGASLLLFFPYLESSFLILSLLDQRNRKRKQKRGGKRRGGRYVAKGAGGLSISGVIGAGAISV